MRQDKEKQRDGSLVAEGCPWGAVLAWLSVLGAPAYAHPVPKQQHDRTIVVQLAPAGVTVDYRLEVDEFTAVYTDLRAVVDRDEMAGFAKPADFYNAFTRGYAPILADNLLATVDGKPLTFRCDKHGHTLMDEKGQQLGHLRCDFAFKAPWPLNPQGRHQFTFRETNYQLESGQIRLSLAASPPLEILAKTEPDRALQALPFTDLKPGDEDRLRDAMAAFDLPQTTASRGRQPPEESARVAAAAPAADGSNGQNDGPADEHHSLLSLLLQSDKGFWTLMALAAVFGAAHALTPGHGKTLVAAYLVGERGTAWHAVLLGVVTTLTHTGVVIAVAAVLYWYFPAGRMSTAAQKNLHTGLALVGGLVVAGLGFWLFLRRLSGQADHVHLGGHGHNHHHGHAHPHDHEHADHYHDEHGNVVAPPPRPVGSWGLVLMGMSGGIVPCWDAIFMLVFAVAKNVLWLALPLVLAFSAGLAGVLVAIGILVVHAKGLGASRWATSRVFQALPLVSAILVMGLGLWMCFDSVPR